MYQKKFKKDLSCEMCVSKRSRNKEFGERGSKVFTVRISKNSFSRSLKRSFGEKRSSKRELCECGVKSVYRVNFQNRVLGGRIRKEVWKEEP